MTFNLLQGWQKYGSAFKMRLFGQKCAVLIGAHVCIGREFALMEIKIVLASLLRKYHWVITPEYSAVAPVLVPPKAQNKLRVRLTTAYTKLRSNVEFRLGLKKLTN